MVKLLYTWPDLLLYFLFTSWVNSVLNGFLPLDAPCTICVSLRGVVRSPHVFFKTCMQSPRWVDPEGAPAVEESFLELTARLRFYS
jgi:hypothetical protein